MPLRSRVLSRNSLGGRSQAVPVQPCPCCSLCPLIDKKCQKCGTLCNRCSTPYRDAYSPRCWGEGPDDEGGAQGALGPAARTPFGGSAPSRSGLSRTIDHAASAKEHNVARGVHVDAVEKAVHDKASAATLRIVFSLTPVISARSAAVTLRLMRRPAYLA